MKKKTEYQVTIGYKAVLTTSVKADSEVDAKAIAMAEFENYRNFGNKIDIQDDNYKVQGVLNMTETWNML